MSDRRVKFSTSSKGSSKSHRSHDDSGLGSSSSEQASLGGRPDRRFTAEDYEDQLNNVGALQEALGQANQKVEQYQKKYDELNGDLTKAHRLNRDTEKRYREECERNARLERLNKNLEDEIRVLSKENLELKTENEELRDQRDDYRQRYFTLSEPVIDSTMRGGSGEPSSPRLRRSTSKHRDAIGSMRKNAEQREEKPNSSRHHRRSPSVSVRPGARSSSKKPYIEKMPGPPSPSDRYHTNYITGPTDTTFGSTDKALYSSTPRTSQPAAPSSYRDVPPTGNYIPYPLEDPRGRRRG
ncbi:uncharacterized protein F4812DRAFT_191511 [Daldinia caldariorum]|uniref:uncharacterized protein n=1 Tax=Daldinia caldariorum TaxID=326644 RepID=UPI00200840C2|nr:uncharacterized protein F4812DRAFT_191511 [Daldinia caldariorum]KAI1471765.1 hypothetical protein F4812DRAFT_191511 [Daldinia caldariorum]